MSNQDCQLVLQSFASVFEGFAFMFIEQEPDLKPEDPEDCLRASIDFKSPDTQGSLEVLAPKDLCTELAENILGTETEELPDAAGENALKEILNVTCGALLAERFGTEEVFDLSIPVAESIPEDTWESRRAAGRHELFWVDESPMLACFAYASRST